MDIGTVIRKRRKEIGMTQEQIAECIGVSTPAVNKWEKGITYPDISLIPVLARLLKVDLNTLFNFNHNVSSEEIICLSRQILECISESGLESGIIMVKAKISEYPTCYPLIYNLALLIESSVIISGLSMGEKAKYSEQIMKWYECAAKGDDENTRVGAIYMLASKYITKEDYEKAQEMVDLLPNKKVMDRQIIQAEIYAKQGKIDEAVRIMECRLLSGINEVQGILMRLTDMEILDKNFDVAEQVANICAESARIFDLWEYNYYVAPMLAAIAKKEIDKSINLIESLLSAAFTTWNMKKSSLYYRIGEKQVEPKGDNPYKTFRAMVPPLLEELKHNEAYEFLRTDGRLKKIIDECNERMMV